MARNVEIKAAVPDFAGVTAALATLSPGPGVTLDQEDTFFVCAGGRLKLRRLAPDRGELIYYERADQPGPRTSHYALTTTAEPDSTSGFVGSSMADSNAAPPRRPRPRARAAARRRRAARRR